MSEGQGPLSATRLNIMLQSVGECVARVAILVAQSQERIARGRRDAHSFGLETQAGRVSLTLANGKNQPARPAGQSDGAR
jgi:hypothetical protein